jgi:hypothetical protein
LQRQAMTASNTFRLGLEKLRDAMNNGDHEVLFAGCDDDLEYRLSQSWGLMPLFVAIDGSWAMIETDDENAAVVAGNEAFAQAFRERIPCYEFEVLNWIDFETGEWGRYSGSPETRTDYRDLTEAYDPKAVGVRPISPRDLEVLDYVYGEGSESRFNLRAEPRPIGEPNDGKRRWWRRVRGRFKWV